MTGSAKFGAFYILLNLLIEVTSLRVPKPCSGFGPVNLIERAIPRIGQLPAGVSIVYDPRSHVHALQFQPDTRDITVPTRDVFKSCQYFPEEFSIFFIIKHNKTVSTTECVFTVSSHKSTLVSVRLEKKKIVFLFDDKQIKFRNPVINDNKWHTIGFSVTGTYVTMTTDCLHRRQRKIKRSFPSYLEIDRTNIEVARCGRSHTLLQGLLKDIILVPGGDVSRRTCPPRMPRSALMDNHIPPVSAETDIASYDNVGPDWEGCRWMDVGNLAFDVYSRSIKVCVNGIWKHVVTNMPESRAQRKLDYFVVHQDLITPSASIDVELFHITGEGLFAIFANSDKPGGRSRGVSGLYKWVENNFRPYQRLPSESAQSWRHFTIGNNFYLAVANYGNGSSLATNSTIYKWHRHRKKFRAFQSIVTYTARDMEYFQIGEDHFLAIANHAKETNQEVESVILKWNGRSRKFETFQNILTVGAYDWTYFRFQDYHFLCVAHAFNGLTTLMESVIYVFQKDKFLPFQTIETNGATDWEYFSIDNEAYLAVANAYNYGPQNFKNRDTYRTNSTIYRLDISKRAFVKYQNFPTYSAIDWEFFTVDGDHYLIVSNAQNGGTETERLTTVYRLQGVDRFVPVHHMYLEPSADWETFQDGDDFYILYSNAKGRKSQVLKATFK